VGEITRGRPRKPLSELKSRPRRKDSNTSNS
jgi:hypothetical protein